MGMFDLIKMLSDANVDYVVVGGLAVALHGYQRLTMDVDIALAMTPDNLARFIDAAIIAKLRPILPIDIEALQKPEQIEQWHHGKGMLAFGLRGPDAMATTIDVLLRPLVPFIELRHAAKIVAIANLNVPIASIEHLITMKTGTGRSKDQIDIEELRKIQAGTQP